jgi:hypothetical protein
MFDIGQTAITPLGSIPIKSYHQALGEARRAAAVELFKRSGGRVGNNGESASGSLLMSGDIVQRPIK